ncbi:MAG: zinc ribbon domain-containing protein [Clostridia bacterium]|nr:zinc ribbon domain-containing protein [Clostridia bacterium]
MKKRTVFRLIFGAISLCFAIADIVLLCVYNGNIFAIGLPFFLCLLGFGGFMAAACFLFLIGQKKADPTVPCPTCGNECEAGSSFCPACGKKLPKIEN